MHYKKYGNEKEGSCPECGRWVDWKPEKVEFDDKGEIVRKGEAKAGGYDGVWACRVEPSDYVFVDDLDGETICPHCGKGV